MNKQEARESELHKTGKRIVIESEYLWVPECVVAVDEIGTKMRILREGMLGVSNGIEELHLEYNYNPDIQVDTEELGKLNIEITVTHGIDMEKLLKINQSGMPTLEIVLTNANSYDMKYLRTYTLTKAEKKWVIPISFINKVYKEKRNLFLEEVNNILKEMHYMKVREGKAKVEKRDKEEEIEINSEKIFEYNYNGVIDEEKDVIQVFTNKGDKEYIVVSLNYKNVDKILQKVSSTDTCYVIDLEDVYKKYLMDANFIVENGVIKREALREEIEKNFNMYDFNMSAKQIKRKLIEKLYRMNVMRTEGKLWVSNCPKCYKDYKYSESNECYISCADVFKRCRNCEDCYEFNYNWETDLVEIKCEKEIEKIIKGIIRFRAEDLWT